MITFTNNSTSIEIVNNDKTTSLTKDGLMIKELADGEFALYQNNLTVYRGLFADVTSPLHPDIESLIADLSTWFIPEVTTDIDLSPIVTELQNGHLSNIETASDLTNTYLTVVMSNVGAINTNTANTVNGVDTTNNHLSIGNVTSNTIATNTANTTTQLTTANANLNTINTTLTTLSIKSGNDLFRQAMMGLLPGYTYRSKVARRSDISTSTPDRVWAASTGTFTFQSAGTVSVVSSSANDTAAGTGARTVQIEGYDASYAYTTETVTLNGTTPVNTVNQYARIFNCTVLTVGSNTTNVGNISLTNVTLQEYIPSGVGIGESSLVTTEDSKQMLVRITLMAATETYAGIAPPTIYLYKRTSVGLKTRIMEIKIYDNNIIDNILLSSRDDLYIEAFSTITNVPSISGIGAITGVGNQTDIFAKIETITF